VAGLRPETVTDGGTGLCRKDPLDLLEDELGLVQVDMPLGFA